MNDCYVTVQGRMLGKLKLGRKHLQMLHDVTSKPYDLKIVSVFVWSVKDCQCVYLCGLLKTVSVCVFVWSVKDCECVCICVVC